MCYRQTTGKRLVVPKTRPHGRPKTKKQSSLEQMKVLEMETLLLNFDLVAYDTTITESVDASLSYAVLPPSESA